MPPSLTVCVPSWHDKHRPERLSTKAQAGIIEPDAVDATMGLASNVAFVYSTGRIPLFTVQVRFLSGLLRIHRRFIFTGWCISRQVEHCVTAPGSAARVGEGEVMFGVSITFMPVAAEA